jgi:hypothetical protein
MDRNPIQLKFIFIYSFIFLFLVPSIAFPEVKEIICEGAYNMGDGETPVVAEKSDQSGTGSHFIAEQAWQPAVEPLNLPCWVDLYRNRKNIVSKPEKCSNSLDDMS